MSDRITNKHLECTIARINRMTGNNESAYSKVSGKLRGNIGNYHLDQAYGGVSLVQMVSESGGVTVVIGRGTKRELHDKMQAFIAGIEVNHV